MSTVTTKTPVTGHTNPDPITGAPASHPGATAIGAGSGAATGAAIGLVGGPVGAAIGAIVGGAVGGWVGHSAGEWNDPSDMTYWRNEYRNRSYFDRGADFENDIAPAYSYGHALAHETSKTPAGAAEHTPPFTEIDQQARQGWERVRGNSKLTYDQASVAVADAYDRKLRRYRESQEDSSQANGAQENRLPDA